MNYLKCKEIMTDTGFKKFVNEVGLKKLFKQYALQNHPDKTGILTENYLTINSCKELFSKNPKIFTNFMMKNDILLKLLSNSYIQLILFFVIYIVLYNISYKISVIDWDKLKNIIRKIISTLMYIFSTVVHIPSYLYKNLKACPYLQLTNRDKQIIENIKEDVQDFNVNSHSKQIVKDIQEDLHFVSKKISIRSREIKNQISNKSKISSKKITGSKKSSIGSKKSLHKKSSSKKLSKF